MSSKTHILGCQSKVVHMQQGLPPVSASFLSLYLREPSRDLERSRATVAFLVFKILAYWSQDVSELKANAHITPISFARQLNPCKSSQGTFPHCLIPAAVCWA